MNKPEVIILTGPTASGKTSLSISLAKKIYKKTGKSVEIISADSRQVYRQIPVTTAQPSAEELKLFKHHFINELELDENFNAGEFGTNARKLINEIFIAGKIPIVVGGSGLYVNSLVYGFFDIAGDDKQLEEKFKEKREELYRIKEEKGFDYLLNELKIHDPELFSAMKEVKERRVIRALEVFYVTGIPISVHQKKKIEINFTPSVYGIQMDRSELYSRINERVLKMIQTGMIEEIKKLKDKGYHYKTHNSLNTVGAKEVFDYLEGMIDKEKMVSLIQQNTRRFAKRQMTWFRRDENIKWISGVSEIDIKEID